MVLSKDYTKSYGFRGDGLITYRTVIDFILGNQIWGYYHKCGTRVFGYIKAILTSTISDWQQLTIVNVITPPVNALFISDTSSNYNLYISSNGTISQGGGGIPAGTYEFRFDYECN